MLILIIGGMVGSLCLNKRFEEAVKDVVGEDQYSTLSKTEAYEKAVSQFNDLIKTAFRGSSDEKYFVHFPMAKLSNRPKNNLIDNCWNMKGFEYIFICQSGPDTNISQRRYQSNF